MANYYGLGRTNYVKIKDMDALNKALEDVPADIEEYVKGDLVAFSGYQSDSGTISEVVFDEDDNEVFPLQIIARHMEEGQVLVYMEAGSEKARYAHGHALAYNSEGTSLSLGLHDIYEKAAEAFDVDINSITEATY